MKFVVYRGTETFGKLTDLFGRVVDCRNAAVKFSQSLGFEGFSSYSNTLHTRIHSFVSKVKPNGYKNLGDGIYPKSTKANKELIASIEALPYVTQKELCDILNFQWQVIRMRAYSQPGVEKCEDFAIIDVSDECKYEPPSDLQELRMSEYHELKSQLERGREAKDVKAAA